MTVLARSQRVLRALASRQEDVDHYFHVYRKAIRPRVTAHQYAAAVEAHEGLRDCRAILWRFSELRGQLFGEGYERRAVVWRLRREAEHLMLTRAYYLNASRVAQRLYRPGQPKGRSDSHAPELEWPGAPGLAFMRNKVIQHADDAWVLGLARVSHVDHPLGPVLRHGAKAPGTGQGQAIEQPFFVHVVEFQAAVLAALRAFLAIHRPELKVPAAVVLPSFSEDEVES